MMNGSKVEVLVIGETTVAGGDTLVSEVGVEAIILEVEGIGFVFVLFGLVKSELSVRVLMKNSRLLGAKLVMIKSGR